MELKVDLNRDFEYEQYTGETDQSATEKFKAKYGRTPNEIIHKYGAIFLGPLTRNEAANRRLQQYAASTDASHRPAGPGDGWKQLSFDKGEPNP